MGVGLSGALVGWICLGWNCGSLGSGGVPVKFGAGAGCGGDAFWMLHEAQTRNVLKEDLHEGRLLFTSDADDIRAKEASAYHDVTLSRHVKVHIKSKSVFFHFCGWKNSSGS